MAKYGRKAHAIAALVRDAEVHRDVYVDLEVFELEMEHLFPNSWVYVGHASQISKPGESLSTIDNMVDRSPERKLAVMATPIRYMHTCNWKMLVENQTDTCHPMVAHESSAGTAVKVWKREQGDSTETPMAVQLYGPFMSPYE